MINRIIHFSVRHKLAVLATIAIACIGGWWALITVPIDATPDLSDTQVIILSRWDRSPDLVEDQVTYPIVTSMLGAPKVKTVRGVFRFRLFLRVCHIRRQHRPLLGAFARYGVHVQRHLSSSRRREDRTGS